MGKQPGTVVYSLKILDKNTKDPLPYATLRIYDDKGGKGYSCNKDGELSIELTSGKKHTLMVTYVGYKKIVQEILPQSNKRMVVYMTPDNTMLNEVMITASESKGMSSASVINKDAMRHLQPSSFSDIIQLLPGGRSRDPLLTVPNAIHIREIPTGDENYATSSLGVSFLIDNMPVREDANMQVVRGATDYLFKKRKFINKGVDMRTISTDNIKSVEIIRGIPSVQYGNLTSGLVKIKRKRDMEDIEARFKADMSSRLFYLGSGTNNLWRNFNLSGGIDYLSAKADPRNVRENYQRITGSLRGTKTFYIGDASLQWQSNVDYTLSIDDEKVDRDLMHSYIDSYRSSYNRFAVGHTLEYQNPKNKWLQDITLDFSFSTQHDRIDVVKYVEISEITPLSNTMKPGEHDGKYLTEAYTSNYAVDGKPIYINTKLTGESRLNFNKVENKLIWGVEWQYDVNKGKGELFDMEKPLSPRMGIRPINFHDIPAGNELSLFAETNTSVPIGNNILTIQAGLRSLSILNLDKQYTMYKKVYCDPRLNIKWDFPSWSIIGNPLQVSLYAGIGWNSMAPTIAQLYPLKSYYDLIELNYFHTNPDYRRLYLKTFIIPGQSEKLQPARNLKKEVRVDASWKGYNLSMTYFVEDMKSGFRPTADLSFLSYKRFHTKDLDHAHLTERPDINVLPFSEESYVAFVPNTSNGSRTLKRGIEFMAYTPRYPKIYTRFTFSGGWFRTTYRNSQAQYYRPDIVLNGKEYKYVGVYNDLEGNVYEMLNTDFRIDTHIPQLGLGVSLSLGSEWMRSSESLPISRYPNYYIDSKFVQHNYTEADAQDLYLQWLRRNNVSSPKTHIPMESNINLKATKYLFERKLEIALFVNRIVNYAPPYKQLDMTIRRRKSPYFGMEMNVKI
ncbi:TonB-dependent receptor [Porphyromonas pogonae]|nr:TonB-dependent receptor [Porphyromonas pogonae]